MKTSKRKIERARKRLRRKVKASRKPEYHDGQQLTTATDPDRLVWVGMCGNWTDDWSYFHGRSGIPICPGCGAPGQQGKASQLLDQTKFENAGRPMYVDFLWSIKETCMNLKNNLECYESFVKSSSKAD